jgi:hypothetical protein
MNTEEQLLVLLGMTEQQQKTITAAVEELKNKPPALTGLHQSCKKPYKRRLRRHWPEVWVTWQKVPRPPSKRP